jgi:FeS assembly protein IscX
MMIQPDDNTNNPLCWDASYEIILALARHYPDVHVEEVGLAQLKAMILALPGFQDDPQIASDDLLKNILREWYEEAESDSLLFARLRQPR